MNKKWEIYQTNEEKVEKLQEKYKLNRLLSTLLTNRGITEEAEITKFLNPKRSDFYDPFGMPDMEKAAERILKAIKDKEQIIIYGDYDVDGITSVTVLKSFLEERGIQVNVYIPNRLNEGYGLNKTAMEEIAKQGNKLMITVDCGITAVDEVEYAKTFGIETIITDHHEPAEELPKAIAVVDAKRKDNKYECRNLAGVGVVFKLIQALSIKLGLDPKEYLKYKAAYTFGTGMLASGQYEIMAAVMAGGMVPPLAIAFLATAFPKKISKKDKQAAYVNYIMGLSFISEGAIPFASADPLRTLPAFVVGSAVTGALSMIFNCTLMAPHGGIFVIATIGHPLLYLLAIAVGTVVSTMIMAKLKKNLPEYDKK